MSPKSNRSGISYGENDPRSLPSTSGGVTVTRARDMEAAIAGLPTADEVEQANETAIEECLAGDDREQRLDYGTPEWTKARLNEELDRREIPHDPKANNSALIDLLEADDVRRAVHGDGNG